MMELTDQEQILVEGSLTEIKRWLRERSPECLSTFEELIHLSQTGDKAALGLLGFVLAAYLAGHENKGLDAKEDKAYTSLN